MIDSDVNDNYAIIAKEVDIDVAGGGTTQAVRCHFSREYLLILAAERWAL